MECPVKRRIVQVMGMVVILFGVTCAKTRGLLVTPSNLKILRESSTSFRVTWSAYSNPTFGAVRLAYETAPNPVTCFSPHVDAAPTDTELTATGFTPNTSYHLLVCTVGVGGDTTEEEHSETLSSLPECDTTNTGLGGGGITFTTFNTLITGLTDQNADGKLTLCLAYNSLIDSVHTTTQVVETNIAINVNDVVVYAPSTRMAQISGTQNSAAIIVSGDRVQLENIDVTTSGTSALGLTASTAVNLKLRNVRFTTVGGGSHGIFLTNTSSIAEMRHVTIRRSASAVTTTASAIVVSNGSSSYFVSSGVSNITVCSLGSNEWEDRTGCTGSSNCGLLANSAPNQVPSSYTPFTGSETGAETFPFVAPLTVGTQSGFTSISLGGQCSN